MAFVKAIPARAPHRRGMAFLELWKALRDGLADARGMLSRRWPLYLAICIVCGVADFIISRVTPLSNSFVGYAVGATAIGFYVLFDTLRLQEPAFTYSFTYLARCVAAVALVLLMWVALWLLLTNLTTWMFPKTLWHVVWSIALLIVGVPLGRFMFVYYLLAQDLRETNSFARSWSLTGGRMLLPTLTLNLGLMLAWFAGGLPALLLPAGTQSTAYLIAAVILSSIDYPIGLRWMQACSKNKTVPGSGDR